jgi:hypothetical protein
MPAQLPGRLAVITRRSELVCVVLTEPAGVGEQADYRAERTSKFGEPVPLDSLGVMLDTSEFGTLPTS